VLSESTEKKLFRATALAETDKRDLVENGLAQSGESPCSGCAEDLFQRSV
jgi:hypothetical protein